MSHCRLSWAMTSPNKRFTLAAWSAYSMTSLMGILSARLRRETEFIMNYFPFSLKILYFHCRLMVSLSIYIILYIIEKLWTASFQWDVKWHSHAFNPYSFFNVKSSHSNILATSNIITITQNWEIYYKMTSIQLSPPLTFWTELYWNIMKLL